MAKKTPNKPLKDCIIDAALALAEEEGWASISFEQIVTAAQVDQADVLEYFDDKSDVLTAYGRRVDRRVLENIGSDSDGLGTRERLFDLIMERFDVLNENRAAVTSILASLKNDPKQAVVSFPHLAKSMTKMLEAAHIETDGVNGALKVTGLVGVYLYALRTWKDDDSADMAKTMAALDKALKNAESVANSFEGGGVLSALSGACERFRPRSDDK